MDFFEHQQQARKRTGRLVAMFIAAVICIIALVYFAAVLCFGLIGGYMRAKSQDPTHAVSDSAPMAFTWWSPEILGAVMVGLLLIVGIAILTKLNELRAGGRVVAESLGGRLLDQGTKDATERKILNVVEEMAIASGVPVPPVYMMDDEASINAFAAGYTPSDAVIGVTRGCVERLSRDELQGVMAHEFSHILNGDMKLNIRLIGVIFGIMVIGFTGGMLFRMVLYSGAGHSRRNNKEGGGLIIAIIAFGVILLIIGFIGTVFGRMIKAAVSRQREFLADAAAVQFTRNPDGIGGALQRIGGLSRGSTIQSPKAEEASHMFFGQALSGFSGLFATHPPLPERIKRIDPSWDGDFIDAGAKSRPSRATHAAAAGFAGETAAPSATETTGAVEQIGQLTNAHVAYAAALIQQIPERWHDAAGEPFGARAVVYGLLLNHESEPREKQLHQLSQHADPTVYELTIQLTKQIDVLPEGGHLPLLDLAIGTLRNLSISQYAAFKLNVDALVHADDRIDVFEWVLHRAIVHHLDPLFTDARRPRVRYRSLSRVTEPCAVLLSALAYVGHQTLDEAQGAFNAAAANLPGISPRLRPPNESALMDLNKALDELAQIDVPLKRHVLNASAACISADHQVTVTESELLRAVSDALDCPMPPLLPGHPMA